MEVRLFMNFWKLQLSVRYIFKNMYLVFSESVLIPTSFKLGLVSDVSFQIMLTSNYSVSETIAILMLRGKSQMIDLPV